MNHSCAHNCALAPLGFEIAIADTAAGEQLTNDYVMLNLEADERLVCQCGLSGCRGVIGPANRRPGEAGWHAEIQAALGRAGAVAQALRPLLSADGLEAALRRYGAAGRLQS